MSNPAARATQDILTQAPPGSRVRSSYSTILKSSAIIGGASVIGILLGIVRTKVLAVLLGPAGMGLVGTYTTIVDLARIVAGVGFNASGVRQVAEAAATRDEQRIARTALTLRRLSLLLGLLGAALLAALCVPVSTFTFGDSTHAKAVAVLSLAVFFGVISSGQSALIQGMRCVSNLGKTTVLGALVGTLSSIPLVVLLGESGIVPYLIAVSVGGMLISWWYARQIPLVRIPFSWHHALGEGAGMLRLGLVMMVSALLVAAVAYLTRVIVVRDLGVESAGYYHAAWTLSGLYVGFIIQAMGADFYPRLTGLAKEPIAANRCLTEQIEVNLLLGVPGVLATLALAPVVIQLFYSSLFTPAVDVLRWQMFGVLVRICSWPLGIFIVAKGSNGLFLALEVGSSIAHILLVWTGVHMFGLPGAGMGFSATYVLYFFASLLAARSISGTPFPASAWRWAVPALLLLGLIFLVQIYTTVIVATWVGTAVAVTSGGFCLSRLLHVLRKQRLERGGSLQGEGPTAGTV